MNLLFVCTGNTCRSPAAEVLARAEAERRGLGDVGVRSAGTLAFPDQPAAGVGVVVARDRGLDLGAHRSREVDLELLEWADHIVAMTASHAHAVARLGPEGTVTVLKDFLPDGHPGRGLDVADPVGGDRTVYESTFDELEEAISAMFDRLAGGAGDA